VGHRGDITLFFHIETSILGVLPKLWLTICFVLVLVVIAQMEIAHCQKKKKKEKKSFGGNRHLIN
jgi:uncharacterized membrane protein